MGIREILNALRAGIITVIVLVLLNITLDFIFYGQCTFKPQAQEYIHPYNGQPIPEFTIIDGELPD